VSDFGRDRIAAGDVIGMILALAAILALHRGSAWAIALTHLLPLDWLTFDKSLILLVAG
jgi:hypothetical protein